MRLVFIHGMWCDDAVWAPMRTWFEMRGWQVETPVLPLHKADLSEPESLQLGRMSLRDYANALQQQLAPMQKDGLVLFGHSMGGLLAQQLAARLPVVALVLMAPAAGWGEEPLNRQSLTTMKKLFQSGRFWRRAHRPPFGWCQKVLFPYVDKTQHESIYAKMVYESGKVQFEMACWPFDIRRAARINRRAIATMPMRVYVGENDRITPPAMVGQCFQGMTNTSLITLADHGHWLPSEHDAQSIYHDIEGWLTTLQA